MDYITLLILGGIIIGFILLIVFIRKIKINKIYKIMDSWLNHDKNELLTSWGPPASVFPIDNGGEIWSYHWIRQTSGYAHEYSDGHIHIDPPQQYTIERQFFINKNGIIYNYRWEGI